MLTADRNTPQAIGDVEEHPMAASARIFAGALVCLTAAGWATRGDEEAAYLTVGRADEHVDNTGGANGAKRIKVRKGVFRFANSAAADAITRAEIGQPAYVADDETVAKTSDDGGRPIAGFIVEVDDQGVWIRIDPALARSHATLVAAIDAIET